MKIKEFGKKIGILVLASMMFGGSLWANPKIILDILQVQSDALSRVSGNTTNNLTSAALIRLDGIISRNIDDGTIGYPDFDDKDILIKAVKEIRSGSQFLTNTAANLDTISSSSKQASIVKQAKDIVGSSLDLGKATKSLYDSIKKGNTFSKIMSGAKFTNSNNTLKNDLKKLINYSKNETDIDKREQISAAIISNLKEYAAQDMREMIKDDDRFNVLVQNKIIEAWKKKEIINENEDKFLKLNAYQEKYVDKWFGDDYPETISNVESVYTNTTNNLKDELDSFEYAYGDFEIPTEYTKDEKEVPEEEKLEKKTVTNPDNKKETNNEQLAELESLKSELEKKLASIDSKSSQASKLKVKLKELQNKLSTMSKYNTVNNTKTNKSIDRHKQKFLILANTFMKRNNGVMFSKWSQKDKDTLNKAASELYGGSGRSLYNQFRMHGVEKLKDKYVVSYTTSNQTNRTYNYKYGNVEKDISNLITEIRTLNLELTQDKIENNQFQVEFDNLTDDYNNENKVNLVALTGDSGTENSETDDSGTGNSETDDSETGNTETDDSETGNTETDDSGTGNTETDDSGTGNTETDDSGTGDIQTTGKWRGKYVGNFYNENDLGEPVLVGYTGSWTKATERPSKNGKVQLIHHSSSSEIVKEVELTNTESTYFGDYQYTAWGTWSSDAEIASLENNKVYTSHWVIGLRTEENDMPSTGSATYEGDIIGVSYDMRVANSVNNVNGTISLDADFASNKINGSMTVNNSSTSGQWAKVTFNNVDINENQFEGTLSGSGISNTETWHSQINGSFNGSKAAEVGGSWAITKGTGSTGDGRATGVFRAKKQ